MGMTNDLKVRIEEVIQQQGLDGVKVRGQIGMKAGVLLSLVNAGTPDDPAKVAKLREVAAQILGRPL